MPGVPIVATDDDAVEARPPHPRREGGRHRRTTSWSWLIATTSSRSSWPFPLPRRRSESASTPMCTEDRLQACKHAAQHTRTLRVDETRGDVALARRGRGRPAGPRGDHARTRASRSSYIAGEAILVTGGGGSIGSELCRQLCASGAGAHRDFRHVRERRLHAAATSCWREYHHIEVVIEIGNVCDAARINEVFEKYRPSAVFHAAAHKHVPLMEVCPREAVQNNVFGTLNVVHAADSYGASHFIFISTDKAVNPTSVMGATKRMGEMVMQYYAHTSKTIFTAVRFGNVLGSNGSVIPLFKRQIAARRAGDGHASGHTALLHDDTGSGPVGHPGRRHGQRRRDIHSRHGRAGEDRRFGEEPHSLVRD